MQPDFFSKLVNNYNGVSSAAKAIPEFLNGLINGYVGPDVSKPRTVLSTHPASYATSNGQTVNYQAPKFGGYPEDAQFMGKTLVPFKDNPVGAVIQRASLIGQGLNTGGQLDPAIDTAKAAGYGVKNYKDFFLGNAPNPFGENPNNNIEGGKPLAPKPYSQLRTEGAKFDYLRNNPKFVPPEQKTEDQKLKDMMTPDQWTIFEMFRAPSSPRVRSEKTNVTTNDNSINAADQNYSSSTNQKGPSIEDLVKNFLMSQSLVPPATTDLVKNYLSGIVGGQKSYTNAQEHLAQNPTNLSPQDIQQLASPLAAGDIQSMPGVSQALLAGIPADLETLNASQQAGYNDLSRNITDKIAGRAVPAQGSVEQIAEEAGGWQPGMRVQFDTALMHKDADAVKALLPQVPADYAARFADEIQNVVGKQTPMAYSDVVKNEPPLIQMYVNQVRNGAKSVADLIKEGLDSATIAHVNDVLQRIPAYPRK